MIEMNLSRQLVIQKTINNLLTPRGRLIESSNCLLSSSSSTLYDIAVVGGGIVGTATARLLSAKYRDFKIILLEKEKKLGKLIGFFLLEIV